MPAPLRRWLLRRWHGAIFSGDFSSWAAARRASGGYDAEVIFERTLAAARAVRDGHATWERDTVLFHAPAVHQPLLDALRVSAAAAGGRLSLLDFGGALGSTWGQHRAWLTDLAEVRWSVVEQPRLVEVGRREFAAGPLRFHETIDACCATEKPDVVLLSAVLPYLEEPHALLRDIARRGFSRVIIDRTGFVGRGRDRLTVQRVPSSIYRASYPCWFFDREKLLQPFAVGWRVAAEWPTFDRADIAADYRGLLLDKIGP
ncbi:MAG: methyltransferase, TIGR04325 family [Opitutaceae bacterium]|nr:methyltransferase, TIGR04325 family [Opitutaceae bacterium]